VAPECATLDIPPHEHHARMRLTHAELTASRGVRDGLQWTLRIPYDVKDQRIRYTTLGGGAPFTPPYGDIHHRTETLTGIGDPSLTFDWERGDFLLLAGTTIPLGRIEPNPVVAGREGRKHEHLQFGSGTFEPRGGAQWAAPLGAAMLFVRAEARLSLYENREGFRAPTTAVWSAGPSFRLAGIDIDPRLDGQYQTVGRWRGEVDEGSGFQNGGARLQLSFRAGPYTLTPGVYRELWSHGFTGESFRQGTTWSLSVTRIY
jgi:hypothetical protein